MSASLYEIKTIELHSGDEFWYVISTCEDFTTIAYREKDRKVLEADTLTFPTEHSKQIAEAILKLSKEK